MRLYALICAGMYYYVQVCEICASMYYYVLGCMTVYSYVLLRTNMY